MDSVDLKLHDSDSCQAAQQDTSSGDSAAVCWTKALDAVMSREQPPSEILSFPSDQVLEVLPLPFSRMVCALLIFLVKYLLPSSIGGLLHAA